MKEDLVQTLDWTTARKIIKPLNPELTKIIDTLSPDKSFKLFKVKYPYGTIIVDKGELFFPSTNSNGKMSGHTAVPPEIKKHLQRRAFPVSIVTQNTTEIFKIMPDRNISRHLIKPGGFFGLWENLDHDNSEYIKWMWSMSSGVRSLYLLPKISNTKGHKQLRAKYHINSHTPKNWASHWDTLIEIVNSQNFGEKWCSEFIFFSDKWFDTATHDPAWKDFLIYMMNTAWQESNYWRNKSTFDLVWEDFLNHVININIKPNLYLASIAKQLILTGIGRLAGFRIANNNTMFGPIERLAEIYIADYNIEYAPIFMVPHMLSFKDTFPTYYSLQCPNLLETVPCINKLPEGILSAIPEIMELMKKFSEKFVNESTIENSPIYQFCKNTRLLYFHATEKKCYGIFSTEKIVEQDKQLQKVLQNYPNKKFPSTSLFLKGCILLKNI